MTPLTEHAVQSRPRHLHPQEMLLWEKAQHATPGPWHPDDSGWFVANHFTRIAGTLGYHPSLPAVANSHYIAAASPDQVTALLLEISTLRAQLAAISDLSECAAAGRSLAHKGL